MIPLPPGQNPGTGSEGVSLETGSADGGGGAVIGVPFPDMGDRPLTQMNIPALDEHCCSLGVLRTR